MEKNERIWIIGGSSGIGLELVKILLDDGFKLVVSSRTATKNEHLEKLQINFKNSLYLIDLDVNDEHFKDKIAEAFGVYDGLDIWFYNAAVYEVMGIDNWDKEKFIQLNNTNYLGVVKLMTDILPFFEKQKYGRWIWNLSLSSYFGLPKGGAYSAPKAALLNLAQSIQPELKNINIDLQVVNHGFVKTRLTAKNDFEMPQLMSPEFTALNIYKKIKNSNSFETSFPFKLSAFLRLLSILPYKISLAITRKMI